MTQEKVPGAQRPARSGGVSYTQAEEGYFEKRQLKRTAGFWGLWGIGVAAVISGDFSGWNFGIGEAGWGGLLIATVIIAVMYFGMLFSIGEMSAAMPHTGGAYSFARSAMGPWGGFVTGLAETIEYVFTTAVIVYFSASYANGATAELFDLDLSDQMWIWWVVLYLVFVGLNAAGAEVSFKFAIVVAVAAVCVLLLFAVLAIANGAVDFGNLMNIEPEEGNSKFLPYGIVPILYALPFAVWFFLGIEELPLAAEEAHDPERDIPRAGIIGLVTLVACGALVLFLNPAVTGSDALAGSDEPLLDGFRSFLSDDWAAVLSLFALLGLLASLQGIMYAYARNMYSLSRAGYYPKALSLTGGRQTPWIALVVGAVIGLAAIIVVDNVGGTAGDIILNIAVWGAVIAYVLQMVSYVMLRRKFPNAARPYVSPVGVPGAVVAGAIAVLTFVGILFNEAYRPAVVAIAIAFVLGLALFALFGRHRLILSPEEEYAMSGGLHRDPAVEDYARLERDELGPNP